MNDSKSPPVSRTLLSILAVLNNAVVRIVSNRAPTSKSSSPFYNPLVTVQKAPLTTDYNYHFIILLSWEFFTPGLPGGLNGSLSDSKFPRFSWTLFSFLTDRWSPLVLLILCLCIGFLVTLLNAPITICITVTFMFKIFHWSLSDNKSPHMSITLLSILGDLNNAVVWMVFTSPIIYKSSSPFTNHLVTVRRAPITIDFTVTFMFHSFFTSLARSRYLHFFISFFSILLSGKPGQKSPQLCWRSFFFCCWLLWYVVVWPWLGYPFVSQNPSRFCVTYFPEYILGCIYRLCSYDQV